MINGELVVDNFAGGGGASTGIEMATGISVDIAINHDPEAIKMHKANHPSTKHYCESVWDVDPVEACHGKPVALAWFSPDCFEKGTLILTDKGYRAIEDIRQGDMVLTHKMRWKKVTDTMYTEREEMVIKGYGHHGIVCSTGHPFYVKTRSKVWNNQKRNYENIYSEPTWKKAKELSSADYWGCPKTVEKIQIPSMEKPNNKTLSLPIDERLLWLAGRYVGDGWTRFTDTKAELVIVCGNNDVSYLEEKLNMWKRKGSRAKGEELSWNYRKVKTGGQFTSSSRSLVKWLRNNFGHLATEKTIPAWLLSASDELKKAFLEGYVGADGYKNGTLTEISTVSKKLAYGIKTLIATMGYFPLVYLQANNSTLIEGRHVSAKPIYKVKWRSETDKKHAQTFEENGIMWLPIRKATRTGKTKNFYNISVEEDESYVAEGIIVHNCKHFSKAKGGTPVEKEIRGLAWVAVRWAAKVKPRVIMLENVEEFQTWGPLRAKRDEKTKRCLVRDYEERKSINEKKAYRTRVAGKGEVTPYSLQLMEPDPNKKGKVFNKFIKALKNLGYVVDYRELRAADYGAPTMRKRFFLIARSDGKPIVWPQPTHAPADSEEVKAGLLKPYLGAYTQLDFSLPCPSIFDTAEEIKEKYGIRAVRPLAPKTMERIAKGLKKFVLDNPEPFIVQVNHSGAKSDYCKSAKEPLSTITGKHGFGLIEPYLVQIGQTGFTSDRSKGVTEPLTTIVSKNEHCLITPKLAPMIDKAYGGNYKGSGSDVNDPLDTITTVDHNRLVEAKLVPYMGVNTSNHPGGKVDEPLHTITTGGQNCLIAPTLIQYHSETSDKEVRGQRIEEPIMTVDGSNRYALVSSFIQSYNGESLQKSVRTIREKEPGSICASTLIQMNKNCYGRDIKQPIPTITAGDGHFGEVRAFLIKYYGNQTVHDVREPLDTITTKDRFGLVTIAGIDYQIVDIGLRMLEPKELYGCQGFPDDYIIDKDYTGKQYPRSEQVRRCGNAVCPPIPAALVRVNLPELCVAVRMPNMKIVSEQNGQLKFA